jgi:alkylation response protein AidB-like acyl-CoA dehydrogenase
VFDLAWSDEQRMIIGTAAELARGPVAAAAGAADRGEELPRELMAILRQSGFTASVPEEFGGPGVASTTDQLLALRELARGEAAVAATGAWT